ncbi:GNAT family N-acetyltransferase [Duganella sp.]|uniref:GNAT family N-acetyltransferase n=1 Tax=Duganella sp. TaxID=1904440 RepID=UPI0031E4177D
MTAELLESWLRARSIARHLPQPVADRGGLRVDTAMPEELRRYVFAGPTPAITQLAQEIHEPYVFIKMCGPGARLQSLVPQRWQLQPAGYLMIKEPGRNPVPSLPPGYWLQVQTEAAVTTARIFTEDDTLAASGYAAEYENVFIFDRIATVPEHQHQGLGAAVMAALGTAQKSQAAQRVLVATEAGRGLYATIGWKVLSPFSTVTITPPF